MPTKKLILSELESSFNFQHVIPPITVINFFTGNLKQVESRIRERWRLIVKKNPWITGRLIKNKDHKRLQLEYLSGDSVTEKHADELLYVNPPKLKLHSKLPYLKM